MSSVQASPYLYSISILTLASTKQVWIPYDPNENPHPNLQDTRLPSIHHWSRASIITLITTQIALTQQVFASMSTNHARYPTASRLHGAAILSSLTGGSFDPMKPMRESHAILALRLKGLEVCEWVEDFDRVEVYFQDVDVKMGQEVSDMKRYREGEARNRKL